MKGYEALVAKCRSMIGNLLTKEQYKEIANQRTIFDLERYLVDKTVYKSAFDGTNIAELSRNKLMFILNNHLFDIHHKLFNFTEGIRHEFVDSQIKKFEIDHLLDAIRQPNRSATHYNYIPTFMLGHSKIDFAKLYAAKTDTELQNILKNTEYSGIIAKYLDDKDPYNYHRLETEIFNYYYIYLYNKVAENLQSGDQKEFKKYIEFYADITNIARIIRMKNFRDNFSAPPPTFSEVLPELIPFSSRLDKAEIAKAVSLPDQKSILEYFAKLYKITDPEILSEINSSGKFCSKLHYKYAKKLTHIESAPLMSALGLLIMTKYEIDNLIYIIESINYGISFGEIEKVLVM